MPRRTYVFPFGISLRRDGHIVTEPVVEIFIALAWGGTVPLMLLIDSGASISALPWTDAEELGSTTRGTVQ